MLLTRLIEQKGSTIGIDCIANDPNLEGIAHVVNSTDDNEQQNDRTDRFNSLDHDGLKVHSNPRGKLNIL